jgi:hypothetical protein
MSQDPSKEFVEFDLTIHVFTVSATLVGVCLTVIGIMRHLGGARASHYGTELLALDAFLYLICCILSYSALKMRNHLKRKSLFTNIADYLFIIALSLMAVICGLIVYEII